MDVPGFIGGSYTSQSPLADCEKSINCYPESAESRSSTAPRALYVTPGISVINNTLPLGQSFAHFAFEGREFAVIGPTFYEIDKYGTATSRGTVALGTQPATICSNGKTGGQIMVTAGGNAYFYNLTTNDFQRKPVLDGLVTMGDELDGYFLILDAKTSTLYWSDLNNGLSWQVTLNFAKRNIAADGWQAMKVCNRMIWLFGSLTSEVWYDSGQYPQPFVPYPSSVIPYGIKAPFSAVCANGSIFWLGASKDGNSVVLQSTGFAPTVISTYALSVAIQGYSRLDDAVGDSYTSLE